MGEKGGGNQEHFDQAMITMTEIQLYYCALSVHSLNTIPHLFKFEYANMCMVFVALIEKHKHYCGINRET
jgi:hypothetical protein